MTVVNDDPEVAFDDILALDLSECDVTVCLASYMKDDIVPRFERLHLSNELANEFRGIAVYLLEQSRRNKNNGNLVLRTYAVESKLDSYEIEHMDLSIYDTILEQIDPLTSLTEIELFGEDEKFIANLRFYVITVQPSEGDPIHFYRSYTPKRMLGRSRMFAMWFSQGQYDKVTQPVFLFDHYIDCVSRGNTMFVFKKDNFQEIFRFFEMVRKVAKETLDNIRSRVPIENFDEFARDCQGHLAKLVKLKNIAAKPYWNRITIHNMKKVIEKNNLSVKIVKTDGKEMLQYDPTDKWVLLKLLDDDYLWSLMTEQSYEVNAKREIL
jgi:hypothetical protein